jgi:hypothetical protein
LVSTALTIGEAVPKTGPPETALGRLSLQAGTTAGFNGNCEANDLTAAVDEADAEWNQIKKDLVKIVGSSLSAGAISAGPAIAAGHALWLIMPVKPSDHATSGRSDSKPSYLVGNRSWQGVTWSASGDGMVSCVARVCSAPQKRGRRLAASLC